MAATKKKRAKASDDTVYEVEYAGMYYAPDPARQGRLLKPYRVKAKVDKATSDKHGFLSPFVNAIAPKMMPKAFQDYLGLHTHFVEGVKNLTHPGQEMEDPTIMGRAQLEEYVENENLPVEVELYQDVDALRQAVIDCEEDEESFKKQQSLRLRVAAEKPNSSKLEQLNDDEDGFEVLPVNPDDPEQIDYNNSTTGGALQPERTDPVATGEAPEKTEKEDPMAGL